MGVLGQSAINTTRDDGKKMREIWGELRTRSPHPWNGKSGAGATCLSEKLEKGGGVMEKRNQVKWE